MHNNFNVKRKTNPTKYGISFLYFKAYHKQLLKWYILYQLFKHFLMIIGNNVCNQSETEFLFISHLHVVTS